MSDPIEQLNRLGDALEGAPMPLPASEIRARGDRIRRRRHAVIAGAGAVVVAAVAVPVIVIGASDSSKEISPADPSISDPVPAPTSSTLSERNLLTDDQAVYPNGGADWRATDTFEGDGQATASPCQQSTFEGLGAGSVYQRDFEFVSTDSGDVEPSLTFNEVIAEFPSDREAEAAYQEIRGWYDDCTPPGSERYDPGEFSDVPIGKVGLVGAAEVQLSTYGPVDEQLDPFGDEGWFLETGLVRIENRIAVLTQLVHGQDYNWPAEGTPVFQMVPDAAAQLAIGNEDQPVDPTPSQAGTDWPTSIPASFPLTSGWPEDDGSSEYRLDAPSADNQAMIPAGELRACGNSVVDPGAGPRLVTRLSYGSDSYVRELELFPTDQEAVTYLAHLRAVYGDCPTEGSAPTFTTEVGDGAIGEESVVITRASDGIGRTVINAVRVGNAVVVDLASDEGVGVTVGDLATVTRENLADVVAALHELQGGSRPDVSDPAALDTIPDGFPLDLALGEPPVEDSETTVSGPGAEVEGVRAQTACGAGLSMPGSDPDPDRQAGYSVATIGGYDGRTIRAYPTVQDALDRMAALRSELQGCDTDGEGDGLSDRVWESFSSDTGYDSVTFGWTYEATEFQGPTAGQLYTVVRVGNAVLAIEWGSEGSARSQADSAPDQVELARQIAGDMCVFAVAGC